MWLNCLSVQAQVPAYFPPFLPNPGPQEAVSRQLIHKICYDYARYTPGVYQLPPGDTVQTQVLEWLRKSGIDYQVNYPEVKINARAAQGIFTNLLSELWADLNQDDLPDLIQKSDGWMIHTPYAGGRQISGLYLDRTGILLKTDSIRLPLADSVGVGITFQASPGNSISLILKTPATHWVQDYQTTDSQSHEVTLRVPLQKAGQAWLSIQVVSASAPLARTFLQELSIKIPDSEQFLLTAPDTLKIETFAFLNFRPEIISDNQGIQLKAQILNGPSWLNTDEKGFLFGRATCPPGLYPLQVAYSNANEKSRVVSYHVEVFPKPAIEKIQPEEAKPAIPEIATLSPQKEEASTIPVKTASKGKKKKGSRVVTPVQKPILEKPIIQAYFLKEDGPSQHIKYTVKKDGYVSLFILSPSGDEVRTLFRYQKYMQGSYNIFWDGSNDAGESLAGGEYECRMEFLPADGTPPHSETCRVLKVF